MAAAADTPHDPLRVRVRFWSERPEHAIDLALDAGALAGDTHRCVTLDGITDALRRLSRMGRPPRSAAVPARSRRGGVALPHAPLKPERDQFWYYYSGSSHDSSAPPTLLAPDARVPLHSALIVRRRPTDYPQPVLVARAVRAALASDGTNLPTGPRRG